MQRLMPYTTPKQWVSLVRTKYSIDTLDVERMHMNQRSI